MHKKSILLAGNWKMNHGPKATYDFLAGLSFPPKPSATMRLYVPYISLDKALSTVKAKNLPIQIGAQNAHFEKSGAFTGEISPGMLTEIGIHQVLVGHSERRQYFNETNETVLKRVVANLNEGHEVLVCIGETRAEREANKTEAILQAQMAPLLSDKTCLEHFSGRLHIAYEPVWAIGTGLTATPQQAEEAHAFIRGLLTQSMGESKAQATKILYGGSVTPANFKELLGCPNIDGGLVGGASLKPESWLALWELC